MEADELFNIQTVSHTDVGLPLNAEGTVFLLGSRASLADSASFLNRAVLVGMDRSTTYYDYKVSIIEMTDAEIEKAGYNVICPIENPLYGTTEYVVATADADSLLLAVSTLIDETERILKSAYKDALILDAFNNPDEFRKVVDKVIVTPRSDDSHDTGLLGAITGGLKDLFCTSGFGFGICASESDMDESDMDESDMDESDMCEMEERGAPDEKAGTDVVQSAALCPKSSEKHFLRNLSAKERKEMFLKIPEKVTSTFEKQDPETTRFLNEVFNILTPAETIALLNEICSQHKGIAQKVTYRITGGASKYDLIIKPRGDKRTKYYRDKLWYVMYLKDAKGSETPLIFKNAPAYCIYVMHVIDRYRSKENTRVLDLRQHRNEFIKVYETLFDEERTQIEHYFDELETRCGGKEGNKPRQGRYNDYIKDIHQTLESMLGAINSMPFKIGSNQFLSLLPSKIQIPATLANLKIS